MGILPEPNRKPVKHKKGVYYVNWTEKKISFFRYSLESTRHNPEKFPFSKVWENVRKTDKSSAIDWITEL